jgi:hypothetical protein
MYAGAQAADAARHRERYAAWSAKDLAPVKIRPPDSCFDISFPPIFFKATYPGGGAGEIVVAAPPPTPDV